MEKRALCLLIITIMLFSSIIAQELPQNPINNSEAKSLQDASNNLLSKQITISDSIQQISSIIFKLDSTISLQEFIVLISLFAMLLFILQALVEIIPLFGEGWKSWIGALVITLLISITGAIKSWAEFFFGVSGFLQFLKDWGLFKLIFALILLGIIGFGVRKLIHIMKNQSRVAENEAAGMKATLPRIKRK